MNCGIYLIEHVASGKVYVGSTCNFRVRWNGHKNALRKGVHHSPHLQAAWNKYGETAFIFKKLLICARNNLVMYEQRAIDAYHAAIRSGGFNTRPSADSMRGHKFSDEVCKKLSRLRKGKKKSQEWIDKIRIANTGRAVSNTAREKLSAANKGKILSAETRSKISKGMSELLQSERGEHLIKSRTKLTQEIADEIRALYATGEYIQNELAKKFGISGAMVSLVTSNKKWVRI